ncbi:HNH endonuclease, partial [Arthrobacter sp. Hz1]
MDGSAAPALIWKGFPLPVTAQRGAFSAGSATVPGSYRVPGVGAVADGGIRVLLDALKALRPAM